VNKLGLAQAPNDAACNNTKNLIKQLEAEKKVD
jgi:hypothetical protein